MVKLTSVCVYCGASTGSSPAFVEAASALGSAIAAADLELVYGGGSVGLMGAVADATLAGGGRVVGIIPDFLHEREVIRRDITELIVTEDMHERKRLMFERADAFVALPGGIGTLEELVEQLTWSQLGQHKKPIVLANIEGFWDPLVSLLDHMKELNFIRPHLDVQYQSADRVADILPAMESALASVTPADMRMEEESAERM